MNNHTTPKRVFGLIGTILLLLIIPVKLFRWIDQAALGAAISGVAPSLLGPSGLLFLLLSGSGRLSRLTLSQIAVIVSFVSLGLEFAQLLPRPGFLAQVRYTFDWYDVAATLASVVLSYWIARLLARRHTLEGKGE